MRASLCAASRSMTSFSSLHRTGRASQPGVIALFSRRHLHGDTADGTPSSPVLPPLLQLSGARLEAAQVSNPASQDESGGTLDWTVGDAGKLECWAIIGPSSERGGKARREIVDIVLGRLRPKRQGNTHEGDGPQRQLSYRPNVHPFLRNLSSKDEGKLHKTPNEAIRHVSFATKMKAGSGDFTNFSARYGAIRDEDRVTLYERLMDLLDVPTGLVAAQKMLPDPLAPDSETPEGAVGLFKWSNQQARETARQRALKADSIIREMAPLVLIDDQLLHRPVIALSNGQTRRARILSSLVSGAELVVLEEPYSGIDVDTRRKLSELFQELHAKRSPRFVLVLREQDEVPDLVTHTLRLNEAGSIVQLGPRYTTSVSSNAETETESGAGTSATSIDNVGYRGLVENAAKGIGRGDRGQAPVISMHEVSVAYGPKKVLDAVDLSLFPGDRLVLAGDNGSGKTTLLALMLGDHPQSFAFPREQLAIFGRARDEPLNARPLLSRRIGHLSPELFNAFPRKSLDRGGLTVGEVIASGFYNVFARRSYSEEQKGRVWGLLARFADLVKSSTGHSVKADAEDQSGSTHSEGDIRAISSRGFAELSHGSQAVILFLRSVVSSPPLLVLDEPFQGMDKRQVQRVRQFLDESTPPLSEHDRWAVGESEIERERDRQSRAQMAIVLVSHYENEWPSRFGRLVRLKEGVVVERV